MRDGLVVTECVCALILWDVLRILSEEVRPHGGDGEGAQGRSQESRDDGKAENLFPHLIELLGLVLVAHVKEDGAQGGLGSGLGQPGQAHQDLLPGAEPRPAQRDEGGDQPEQEPAHQHKHGVTQALCLDTLNLRSNQTRLAVDRVKP